jgi:hypothetical protein
MPLSLHDSSCRQAQTPGCRSTRISQEKPMRFMIIVNATAESEAETSPAPEEAVLAEIEVRPPYERENFAPSESLDRLREMGVGK